jgi:hypothetical protein
MTSILDREIAVERPGDRDKPERVVETILHYRLRWYPVSALAAA